MNNLLALLLAAAEEGAGQPASNDVGQLVVQYIVYGVIIVVSIFLLILLRKRTRLPRHTELKKKVQGLLSDIRAIDPAEKRMNFLKNVSGAMYKADNLSYTAAMLAEKERYADLGRLSSKLGEVRAELSPYKFGKKEACDSDGIDAAAKKVEEALAILDGIIERDGELRRG